MYVIKKQVTNRKSRLAIRVTLSTSRCCNDDLVWWECCKVNGKNLSLICSGIKWFKALNIYVPTSYSVMSWTLSHCSFLSNAEWSARSKGIPVIIQTALFCRFCSLCLSASPQFPQTTLQYLIWGSISALYIISRLSLGNTVLILLRIPMFLLSFPEMYSICCSHDRCSSIIKPRFLACFTRLIGALLIYRAYGVVSGDLNFLVVLMCQWS